jgi:hypothetical protein
LYGNGLGALARRDTRLAENRTKAASWGLIFGDKRSLGEETDTPQNGRMLEQGWLEGASRVASRTQIERSKSHGRHELNEDAADKN